MFASRSQQKQKQELLQQQAGAIFGPQQPQQPTPPEIQQPEQPELAPPEVGMAPPEVGMAPPQQPPQPKMDINEVAVRLGVLPFNEYLKIKQQESAAKEKSRIQQEMPERTQMVKNVTKILERGKMAERKIQDYKSLIELAEGEDLRTGWPRQMLDKFGLAHMAQSTASEIAEKFIGDINLASLPEVTTAGRVTAGLLKEVAKTNPSLLQRKESLKDISKIRILSEKVQKAYADSIRDVKNKYRGEPMPLDIEERALDKAKSKIEIYHKKQLELAQRIANKSKGLPQERKTFSQLPDPAQFKGRKLRDPDTGKFVQSTGTSWVGA